MEASRANADAVAVHGIDEIADHYATYMATQPSRPIVIGHSFGGLLADKLLGDGHAIAGVGIDAAPIKGVLPLPISALSCLRGVEEPRQHRRRGIADQESSSATASATESARTTPTSFRQMGDPLARTPLFQSASANFNPHAQTKVDTNNQDRGPLLPTMGGKDHTVPETVSKSTHKKYRHSQATTQLAEFAVRGHSLTIDHGWREIADSVRSWLNAKRIRDSQRLVRRDATSLPHLASELRPNGCDTSN